MYAFIPALSIVLLTCWFWFLQVFIDSLALDGVEWDVSAKNQLALYRKDRSVNLLIQTKQVGNTVSVVH